jgi:uncharacterized protein YbjT (DUF2867 family)
MQKILVIGSTGKVGQSLVQHLVQAGEQVRAATRNPQAVTSHIKGVEPVRFDYTDPSTFAPALEGVDRVFVIEPQPAHDRPSHEFMIPLIEAAARARTKIVLMSSASVDFDTKEPLFHVEEALRATNRPWVILRPNWFMDNFHTMWLEPILAEGIVPAPAAEGATSFIDTRDVAAAAAGALRSDRFNQRIFTLTGPEAITWRQAAESIAAATGRNITYIPIDDDSFRQSLLDAGLPSHLADYLTNLFGPTREGRSAFLTRDVQELSGLTPRSFADYARDHAAIWKQQPVAAQQ